MTFLDEVLCRVRDECVAADKKFPGQYASAHEGLAVIWEEFEGLKVEVFKKQPERDGEAILKEAIHVAVTAVRFARDAACDFGE